MHIPAAPACHGSYIGWLRVGINPRGRRILSGLKSKEEKLEKDYATVGYVNFLFGIFCANWARATKRNPWSWFFFGFFLAPIAGIVLIAQKDDHEKG
jgi:hypothetical protein